MIEITDKTRSVVDPVLIKKAAQAFLDEYGKQDQELSIVLLGDAAIRKLNKQYRQIDRVTDVLAFEGEDGMLGEIIIDYQQIKRQAKSLGHSVNEELVFILVHGLLHLVGYDDHTVKDKEEMIRLGEEFIRNNKF